MQYQANVFKLLDIGKHVYNHYPGPCRVVEGLEYGAEKVWAQQRDFLVESFRKKGKKRHFGLFVAKLAYGAESLVNIGSF